MHKKESGPGSAEGLNWFKREFNIFTGKAITLKELLEQLRPNDSASTKKAIEALKDCRLQYKRFAFFLEYFFPDEAFIFNGPPVQEIDPFQDEVIDPAGLQLIESLLYEGNAYRNREELVKQADLLVRSSEIFPLSLNDFKTQGPEVLTSIHLELVRIMTLYITGYDAPRIKTGIVEAHESLSAIDSALAIYTENDPHRDSIRYYMGAGEKYLDAHPDFDSFDRLAFITRYAQPLEKYLNQLIRKSAPDPNSFTALNPRADNLFTAAALDKNAFPHSENEKDTAIAGLGKRLFFESFLSGGRSRSCASCHSPAAYFTDGMPRNRSLDGKSDLPRNTPSLFYAGYQYNQFWDGRVGSLDEQINAVLNNKSEMNSSADTITKRLERVPGYVTAFKKIWPTDSAIGFNRVAGALAAYIRNLAPFRSAFDRYMQGDRSALSLNQQKGFNLFMGKAQCGTCHFAPLFNGLLPPQYKTTEFEILGTPADDHLEKAKADSDQGLFTLFPDPHNKGAFKTPTVRNAAVTPPYMHNGGFSTLEKVIDFYDKGGGAGLGLNVPEQTLSSIPLHLSDQEKTDLVAFIQSLTDK
ncbi:MAG TPA: cytochrome c peroxidase [Puia sp.]